MPTDEASMRRASVPGADAAIGVRVPVLSHGFVALVDYMGNDAAIVQAARVSYGEGTKTVRDDRGLIRYLMRHRHTTPFEMVEFKFLVRLPIFVARQWIRHRTACLAEGTKVYFDLPRGKRNNAAALHSLSIDEIWRRFQPTPNRIPRKQRDSFRRRDRVQGMLLRQLNETTQTFGHTHIVGVTKSGPKPVFRMELDDGKTIECTADHRFLFRDGWSTLAERVGLVEQGGRAVWDRADQFVYVNGTGVVRPALYHDRDWLEDVIVRQARPPAEVAEACGAAPDTIAAWCRHFGILPPLTGGEFERGSPNGHLSPSQRGFDPLRRINGDRGEPYTSKRWLEDRWARPCRSAGAIAAESASSTATIRRRLRLHGLARHPSVTLSRPYPPDNAPSNHGRRHRPDPHEQSEAHFAFLQATRSAPASNFWRGALSSEREGIGRWTSQIAPKVHAHHLWTCQLCFRRRGDLHAHHIVPVWADLTRARDPTNLTTLCAECHTEVHLDELAYVTRLGGPAVDAEWIPKFRVAWNRRTAPRTVRVRAIEFVGTKMTYDLEVEGPSHNFVANGIITHNSVNEHSARYSIVPDEYEVPPSEEVRRQSGRNRQGRDQALPTDIVEGFRSDLDRISRDAYEAYTRALDAGVARETARLLLPVAYYTQWYWKTNLWNLFHFLSLRLDPHAQEEIRQYAAELAKIARTVTPVAFEAFEDFQLSGLSLGRKEQRAVRLLLDGKTPEEACAAAGLPLIREDGQRMKTGEGVEFLEKLERLRTQD